MTTMPGIPDGTEAGRKRKIKDVTSNVIKRRRVTQDDTIQEDDFESDILLLESQILESRKNFNNIPKLLGYVKNHTAIDQRDLVASVVLCRVFCRLMAAGDLKRSREISVNEATVVQWLRERLQDYEASLLEMLSTGDPARQSTILTLVMRLMKEEANHLNLSEDGIWRTGLFAKLLSILVESSAKREIREEFIAKYVEKFDDVRYYTFARLAYVQIAFLIKKNEIDIECRELVSNCGSEVVLQQILAILAAVENVREDHEDLKNFYVGQPAKQKHDLCSLTGHKKVAQKAWMAVLRQDLNKSQRKAILDLMSHRIAPWFLRNELLMDFLTDSFNTGGSTALMALSGLFYLIQHKNLDYPQFYQKVYSLLDANILHSKHRSRFFRLLDTFLSSTHLPAVLVASFIKRLSRLTLYAPPSGIIMVVPWIYNLLKNHPSCTFMIHSTTDLPRKDEVVWGEPFITDEPDPMETNAIESSLWEIHMLQSHYHPNVATIAKIISEQFTKQIYNLEDFLDHSYSTVRSSPS